MRKSGFGSMSRMAYTELLMRVYGASTEILAILAIDVIVCFVVTCQASSILTVGGIPVHVTHVPEIT